MPAPPSPLLLSWYHDTADAFARSLNDRPANANADSKGSAVQWIQFSGSYKSHQECEARRADLQDDPMIRAQMKEDRCVSR